MLYRGPFRPYPAAAAFVREVLAGYLPYELKERHPDGDTAGGGRPPASAAPPPPACWLPGLRPLLRHPGASPPQLGGASAASLSRRHK